ncbi:hypothetical protein H4O14_02310 [Bacillus sp. PAMC26568]|nr:hypothetical protein H4O14_02310 [Bacillus sp. PAMC26568]
MNKKEQLIADVNALWIGGFYSSNAAMSRINEILKMKDVQADTAAFFNEKGEKVAEFKNIKISIS